ncbi:hypothetical protein BU24DRAFT_159044 [Aaosphaeria arxii CBS 175.79]|uniref:Uncharacterized protein n=1 Tax=Aaosphaeria arxii CBS 175.79 TaxID=1450172 RepID=A0A6A5XYK3_9PLEO|nr:uncharacterized protein BU24DRAFT_159044 [Aaosphaeria arxii CBS 175.79]KAF2017791.1 hypothetical protein BU24DRAFT_159044 [Aaosphaeria arxii CBS 175.79]
MGRIVRRAIGSEGRVGLGRGWRGGRCTRPTPGSQSPIDCTRSGPISVNPINSHTAIQIRSAIRTVTLYCHQLKLPPVGVRCGPDADGSSSNRISRLLSRLFSDHSFNHLVLAFPHRSRLHYPLDLFVVRMCYGVHCTHPTSSNHCYRLALGS